MKVLLIDTWSYGASFFDPVVRQLTPDAEVILLHGDTLHGIDTSYFDKMASTGYNAVYDLKHFDYSFCRAFEDLKPDRVVFVSMHGLFHRWANLCAEKYSIRSVFFMHGVRFSGGKRTAKPFWERCRRAKHYLFQWSLFLRDFFRFGSSSASDFKIIFFSFLEFFFKNSIFSSNPSFKWGLKFKAVCVNHADDIDYFSSFVGAESTSFVVTGNVTSRASAINSCGYSEERNNIVFLSQPLVGSGYLPEEQYLLFLERLNLLVPSILGGKFVVRPHPRDDWEVIQTLQTSNVRFSGNRLLEVDLASASCVIGINSSALLGCVEIGMPVGVVKFDGVPLISAVESSSSSVVLGLDTLEEDLRHLASICTSQTSGISCVGLERSEVIIAREVLDG